MDERESEERLPILLGPLAGIAAFALIVGLLGYSLFHAFDGGDPAPRRAAAPPPTLTPSITAAQLALTPYPDLPNRALYIFILCDGETVEGEIYSGPIYGDSVALEQTPDHDIIVDLLAGKQTILPSKAPVFQSACAKRTFGTGVLSN